LYDELFAAWKLEKDSETIQPLPSDFFRKALDYLSQLKESLLHEKAGSSIESARNREIKYTEYMLTNLLEMRAKKIALLSLLDSAKLDSMLVGAEVELGNSLQELVRDYRKQSVEPGSSFVTKTQENPKIEEHLRTGARETPPLILLRVLQPIPKLVGVDLDEYGPFQPEDIVYLPRENALVLISRGVASEVKI
jgi:DNA replication initiation complex subunit (GINS family)